MLDLHFVCDHLDSVRTNCANRGVSVDLDGLLAARDKRQDLLGRIEASRREQNEIAASIPKEKDAVAKQALVARGKELKPLVSGLEEELKGVEAALHSTLSHIPNMTHPDAPVGKLDTDNKVVKTWGTPREFGFKPLDHVALAEKHDLIDLESGRRVAGHGFYFLKNEAVLLEMALIQYAMRELRKRGFVLHTTPDVARDDVLHGTGYIPRGNETQIYSVQDTELSLVATAEITLGGTLKDQIVDAEKLPMKLAGVSHCFRTEAGAHGKATRGIYRVHQFTKVEMFAFTLPEQSEAVHKEIVDIEEAIFQGLEIPYRMIDTCTGDLGGPAYRKFDLEAWMPGRGEAGEYGEVTSASNCTDFQARRLGTRYRSADKKGTQFVHTLNGTAVAITRALIAVLENHQQADGSISIPVALRHWTDCDKIG
jgi:seryl-tRNA synthetase